MSYEYRHNSEARPFAYGFSAPPSCHQSQPLESQGQITEEMTDSNMENPANFQKNVEQHPDGSTESPKPKNQKDSLNFGWFSLPHSKHGCASGDDRTKSPSEVGGGIDTLTSQERPASKEKHQQSKQYPKSSIGPWTDTESQGPQHGMEAPVACSDVDQHGFEHQMQSYDQQPHNQPVCEGYDAVDWPMSVIAKELMPKLPCTPKSSIQPRAQMARSEIQDLPFIPLPPLHWQGYQNCSRPTYASWHDNWQNNSDHKPTPLGSRCKDSNNSNHGKNVNRSHVKNSSKHQGKNANKTREKNTNINNNARESLTNSVCYSNNALLCPSNYPADSNNNNWLINDDYEKSPMGQVRTLSPYGQSSETVPRFYSPNVVMKWEDTDDRSNTTRENQSFNQTSLMKRIRSSFFQMWSILSCLKNKDDETAKQGSRLIKYDRFDYDHKVQNAQSPDGRD